MWDNGFGVVDGGQDTFSSGARKGMGIWQEVESSGENYQADTNGEEVAFGER